VGHFVSACGRCRNKYSNSRCPKGAPESCLEWRLQEKPVRIRAAAFGDVCTRVQRRRKFGCATFLGETHVSVDASVVMTPAADGVSPIQRARTSAIAARMIPVCCVRGPQCQLRT
jgi:hypothetical protein